MKVTLRQRLKSKSISLYLDFYHKGKREYEFLNLYLKPGPKLTKEEKNENKRILEFAEGVRAKRQVEIQNGIFGFENQSKLNASFISYFQLLTKKRYNSQGNYGNWGSALKHLKAFVTCDVTFGQINNIWLSSFKEYLENEARTRSDKPLSQNTQHSYFNKVKAALKQALKEGIIKKNPAEEVDAIKAGETQREFLTLEELQALATTECEVPLIKIAFLFSALTGLRWSDIQKLTWGDLQFSREQGYFIRFRQKKTTGAEYHPISDQARSLLGIEGMREEKVFKNLKYSAHNNSKILIWVSKAGIKKHITFHCARHTYATLMLPHSDFYTVSKMLGHRSIKTTQIYAKVVDARKREAADKIYF